ncbi:MAG: NFACT family protein, partial [Coprococcus sp.]
MALDGLVISNLVYELSEALTGGRINKIYQPEPDALILGIKNNRTNYKLLISASASLPLIYLTTESPANPTTAPNFCMLLRKHLNGGKILSVTQPGLERIIHFHIEHLNEMGDICEKILIVELMGKHSNIIFCQPDMTIIDSIKHISANVSSVREVLPGRTYFIAETQHKLNPLDIDQETFLTQVLSQPLSVSKALYTTITGISPLIAEELCFRASIDSGISTKALSELEQLHLYKTFERLTEDIREHRYLPNIVSDEGTPVEFSSTQLTCYGELQEETFDSISDVLQYYYSARNAATRIRQRSSDLRRIVTTALDRCRKKYALQERQLKDTEKKDKYRIYGEMINTYGYSLDSGAKVLDCVNYYTNEEIHVPLDPQLTPHENSVKYFERYNKLKRTFDALSIQIQETKDELEHLDSISTALDIAVVEDDL